VKTCSCANVKRTLSGCRTSPALVSPSFCIASVTFFGAHIQKLRDPGPISRRARTSRYAFTSVITTVDARRPRLQIGMALQTEWGRRHVDSAVFADQIELRRRGTALATVRNRKGTFHGSMGRHASSLTAESRYDFRQPPDD